MLVKRDQRLAGTVAAVTGDQISDEARAVLAAVLVIFALPVKYGNIVVGQWAVKALR